MHALRGDELMIAQDHWPEPSLAPPPGAEGAGAVDATAAAAAAAEEDHVTRLVRQMLADEATLNDALEFCRRDYTHLPSFACLKYRVAIELSDALEALGGGGGGGAGAAGAPAPVAAPGPTLEDALAALLEELEGKWRAAVATNDEDIADLCSTPRPPAAALFREFFPHHSYAAAAL